jgi:Nuclease-related domain
MQPAQHSTGRAARAERRRPAPAARRSWRAALGPLAAYAAGVVLARATLGGAVIVLALAGGALAARLWSPSREGRRCAPRAWRRIAHGERLTGTVLDRLRDHGWQVLHDRSAPGCRAGIGHLVIGPPGVFVVESKNLRRLLAWRPGEGWAHGERLLASLLGPTRSAVGSVNQALADVLAPLRVVARPVWCVHGPLVLPRRELMVEEVLLVAPRRVARTLAGGPSRLGPDAVAAIAAAADDRLPPAGQPRPVGLAVRSPAARARR